MGSKEQKCLEFMSLNLIFSQNFSADLKMPTVKYKLHYERCTRLRFRPFHYHDFNFLGTRIGLIYISSFPSSKLGILFFKDITILSTPNHK